MKYLAIVTLGALTGCSTWNATIDGAQEIVNETVRASGNGVANVTTAIGDDVSNTVTYVTQGAATGIRKITDSEEK
jgi:hypothetical protein